MDDKQLDRLLKKIDILVKLTALNVLKNMTVKEKVKTLSGLGLKPIEIARVIDKTRNQVYVTLHEIRKEEKSEEDKTPNLQNS